MRDALHSSAVAPDRQDAPSWIVCLCSLFLSSMSRMRAIADVARIMTSESIACALSTGSLHEAMPISMCYGVHMYRVEPRIRYALSQDHPPHEPHGRHTLAKKGSSWSLESLVASNGERNGASNGERTGASNGAEHDGELTWTCNTTLGGKDSLVRAMRGGGSSRRAAQGASLR